MGPGSVNIADAIAKARGIAAEKGLAYDPDRREEPFRSRLYFTDWT